MMHPAMLAQMNAATQAYQHALSQYGGGGNGLSGMGQVLATQPYGGGTYQQAGVYSQPAPAPTIIPEVPPQLDCPADSVFANPDHAAKVREYCETLKDYAPTQAAHGLLMAYNIHWGGNVLTVHGYGPPHGIYYVDSAGALFHAMDVLGAIEDKNEKLNEHLVWQSLTRTQPSQVSFSSKPLRLDWSLVAIVASAFVALIATIVQWALR
jgi:hypothetical protein